MKKTWIYWAGITLFGIGVSILFAGELVPKYNYPSTGIALFAVGGLAMVYAIGTKNSKRNDFRGFVVSKEEAISRHEIHLITDEEQDRRDIEHHRYLVNFDDMPIRARRGDQEIGERLALADKAA